MSDQWNVLIDLFNKKVGKRIDNFCASNIIWKIFQDFQEEICVWDTKHPCITNGIFTLFANFLFIFFHFQLERRSKMNIFIIYRIVTVPCAVIFSSLSCVWYFAIYHIKCQANFSMLFDIAYNTHINGVHTRFCFTDYHYPNSLFVLFSLTLLW